MNPIIVLLESGIFSIYVSHKGDDVKKEEDWIKEDPGGQDNIEENIESEKAGKRHKYFFRFHLSRILVILIQTCCMCTFTRL